ncbi:MAG: DEAD/DEAH box helicase [Chloroflexi bacterium]|nr:DEAD/DEAH box helicase [Chloroflexota bacterium]
MDSLAFLERLMCLPRYRGQAEHVELIPPRQPNFVQPEPPPPPPLLKALERTGQWPLYSHQAQSLALAREGHNIMVATGTASGKTLGYNLPVLEGLGKGGRAFYLFPTKALAQDQRRALEELTRAGGLDVPFDTFDGDTPSELRAAIRRQAHIIITNPDMLHLGILPNHALWASFLSRLKYVVADEAHVYRGVFGSHVALVLRRLRRLARHYGSHPQFILCSATIANPKEHAERLTDLPFQVIDEDGSPYGGKRFVLWNPPFLGQDVRGSANSEATFLLAELITQGIRSLGFARTRRLAELICLYLKKRLARDDPSLAERVSPYRAGYLPDERRRIEQGLFQGQLMGAVSTTALELGVDIGDLGATVLAGYPGSIASTWQQAGRSGRRGTTESLSFLVGMDNPLDQYLMHHPEALFGKPHEHALINPSNPHILQPHLLCAAWEAPLTSLDEGIFGSGYAKAVAQLEAKGLLRFRARRYYLSPHVRYPTQDINIRSASSRSYTLVNASRGNTLMETIEEATAFFHIYPGAIYLHQGEAFLVTSLDLASMTAYATPHKADYYTDTIDTTEIAVHEVLGAKRAGTVQAFLGRVTVTTHVAGFKRKRIYTDEVIGVIPLDLPPQSYSTVALWFDIPEGMEMSLTREGLDFAGGLHAAEHATIALLPLYALCDRNDIGGVSTPLHADTGKSQVFIYDAHPGGTGIAEKGYEMMGELWQATLKAIEECPCQEGCPSCIQSPKCGNNNEPLDKKAATRILIALLGDRENL